MAPAPLGNPVARVETLVTAQSALLDSWVAFRCREEPDLDDAKLRRSLGGYLRWAGHMMAAALASLQRRAWHGAAAMLSDAFRDGLDLAASTPRRPDGMPTLLHEVVVVHCLVRRLSQKDSPWLAGDLEWPLQIAMVVGGEKRVQAIDAEARDTATLALFVVAADLAEAGASSLATPPEPLATLERVTSGGRDLSPHEARCAGRWIYQESYTSGGFSARTELHMVLLPNGVCARSAQSVATSTFRDASGNWSGATDAMSRLEPGERGHWRLEGRILTLEMDDGSAYEYDVTLSGASLMTRNTSGGQQRYWQRGQL